MVVAFEHLDRKDQLNFLKHIKIPEEIEYIKRAQLETDCNWLKDLKGDLL